MLITKSALARQLGIRPSAITRHVHAGMPVLPDGKLDLDAALRWLDENVNPAGRMTRNANKLLRQHPFDLDRFLADTAHFAED
jgi:hypothetical protein